MGRYYCHECQSYKDHDWDGFEVNPLDVGGPAICTDCLEAIEEGLASIEAQEQEPSEAQEWHDYDPDC